jgi:hypothetical protein
MKQSLFVPAKILYANLIFGCKVALWVEGSEALNSDPYNKIV